MKKTGLFLLFFLSISTLAISDTNLMNKGVSGSTERTNSFLLANLDFFMNFSLFSNKDFDVMGEFLQSENSKTNRKVKK